MSFIRLGCVEDVPRSNPNADGSTKNNEKKNIFGPPKEKGGYGFEVVSVGETIKLDKLLKKTCKYHKKVTALSPLTDVNL